MKDTPEYSRLLIHENDLPDLGCRFPQAMLDLMRMQVSAGMERTKPQWHELLNKTGFKIVKICRADEGNVAAVEASSRLRFLITKFVHTRLFGLVD